MRFLVQCVDRAKVSVNGEITGEIGRGMCVLVGVSNDDTREIADKMLAKLIGLRIFPDDNGNTNVNLADVNGSLLIVSQFTLYADMRRGHRPGFTKSAGRSVAEPMYDYIVGKAREMTENVQTGVFGADMKLELVNDGPFTVMLDSEELGF